MSKVYPENYYNVLYEGKVVEVQTLANLYSGEPHIYHREVLYSNWNHPNFGDSTWDLLEKEYEIRTGNNFRDALYHGDAEVIPFLFESLKKLGEQFIAENPEARNFIKVISEVERYRVEGCSKWRTEFNNRHINDFLSMPDSWDCCTLPGENGWKIRLTCLDGYGYQWKLVRFRECYPEEASSEATKDLFHRWENSWMEPHCELSNADFRDYELGGGDSRGRNSEGEPN